MPNVYCVSDTHGNLPSVPQDADLLVMAGDICPDFRPHSIARQWSYVDDTGEQQLDWLASDFRRWLESLEAQGTKVVAIWGNHDFVGERLRSRVRTLHLPWVLLEDELYLTHGLKIYGTAWVPGLPYWAFYADDTTLRNRADAIPTGLDILLTHGPPYGAGDLIPTSPKQRQKYENFDGERVGDKWLTNAVRKKAPKVVVCGHIHEDRGIHRLAPTDNGILPPYNVMNVAAVKPGTYDLMADPVIRLPQFND